MGRAKALSSLREDRMDIPNGKGRNMSKVIDLFAGAGGMGLGFEMANYSVELSLEIDKWACQTLLENRPNHVIINADIQDYQSECEISSLYDRTPDVIIGGPPCQGFSVSGPAKKDPQDPRNSLFLNFALWVKHLQPKIFVMENVKGILGRKNSDGKKVTDIIEREFFHLGYDLDVWLLNAAHYGVPQNRERVFFVGNKLGIDCINPPPHTHSYLRNSEGNQRSFFEPENTKQTVSIWEAISDLPELEAGQGLEKQAYISPPQNEYQEWIRGNCDVLFNHVAMNHSKRLVERFRQIGWGESSSDVSSEFMPRARNGNGKISDRVYDQNNRRLYPHRPSHTIAASFYANFIHPFQHRNITAREGARIQSFPDGYRFMGKKTTPSHKLLQRENRLDEKHLCQYNQIGNAVPLTCPPRTGPVIMLVMGRRKGERWRRRDIRRSR